MATVRFGLYFIPEEGEFYKKGSSVVGYDIRNQRTVELPDFIKLEWTTISGRYGFHATVTDALDIDEAQLPQIKDRVKDVLACLKPTNEYVLQKTRVGFWHAQSDQLAIHLAPNRNVEVLHDVLAATIHPLAQGSAYSEQYERDKENYFPDSPSQVAKTKLLHAPFIFDEFTPHFTCINPFDGTADERQGLEQNLQQLFENVDKLEFHKLSLVVRESGADRFRIVEEFSLHGSER